jgi:hypothetical protein
MGCPCHQPAATTKMGKMLTGLSTINPNLPMPGDETVTPQELAAMLHGREYPNDVTKEVAMLAKENDLVIVHGGSDDIMYFAGAMAEEIGAYNGHTAHIDVQGAVPEFADLCLDQDEEGLRRYFASAGARREIDAVWDEDDISWQYRTTIPHVTFDIMEDEEVYCRGIVFAVKDCDMRNAALERAETAEAALHRLNSGKDLQDLMQINNDLLARVAKADAALERVRAYIEATIDCPHGPRDADYWNGYAQALRYVCGAAGFTIIPAIPASPLRVEFPA